MHVLCVAGESPLHKDQVALLEKQVAELREQLLAKDAIVEGARAEMESLIRTHKAAMKVSGKGVLWKGAVIMTFQEGHFG